MRVVPDKIPLTATSPPNGGEEKMRFMREKNFGLELSLYQADRALALPVLEPTVESWTAREDQTDPHA